MYFLMVYFKVCSKVDCERLKRNFGHFLLTCTNHGWTLDEMIEKSQQVILHHFNDHHMCGEWCKYRNDPITPEEAKQRQNRFRQKDGELWKHVNVIFSELTTRDKMAQCFHCFSCQKNESLNNNMAFLAPKNKTFSLTHSLLDRAHFLVIVDTWGHEKGITKILELLGASVETAARYHLRKCDERHAYFSAWQKDPKHMKERADKQMKNVRTGWKDSKQDEQQGYTYAPGMAVDNDGKCKRCKHCGRDDHQRMGRRCPKYPEFQARKQRGKTK